MRKLFILILAVVFTISCSDEIVLSNTPENVFQQFWNIMDEQYVYFEEKNINWDSIYTIYYPLAKNASNDTELFKIFEKIIPLFKDGHLGFTNNSQNGIGYYPDSYYLYSTPPYWLWDFKQKTYTSYFQSSQHQHKKYSYVKFEGTNGTFDNSFIISDIMKLDFSDGLIIDLRNYQGGTLDVVLKFVSNFYLGDRTLIYATPKKSNKRNDFGDKLFINYKGNGLVSDKTPIIILTGIATYSAGNFIAYILNELPNTLSVGTTTGGGGSPRKDMYLPNGWITSIPFQKFFSKNGYNMEYGLIPDYFVEYKYDHDNEIYDPQFSKAFELLDSINNQL